MGTSAYEAARNIADALVKQEELPTPQKKSVEFKLTKDIIFHIVHFLNTPVPDQL
jgi:hypothetical protein